MKIIINSGTGIGKTRLAAFDKALFNAGVANYNLIPLSSVIPENARLVIEKPNTKESEYGHKLYVVLAVSYADIIGREAWSGLGWVNHTDGSGKGLFVEHDSDSKDGVESLINQSLTSMASYRPEERGEIHTKVEGIICEGDPVCSIVVAVYKSEGWE